MEAPISSIRRLLTHPKIFWFFLAILSLTAMGIAWFASTNYGAGVGTDGIVYLSSAENLLSGKGLVDYSGAPVYRWPPLYPLILALLAWSAQTTTFQAGWFLNMFLYGGTIWLGGILLKKCFPSRIFWAYIGSLIIATSSSLLSLAITINTDLFFIFLTWGFIIIVGYYIMSPTKLNLLAMTILAGLAAFIRLPGITLAVTGLVIILWVNRQNLRSGLLQGFLFFLLSLIILASWVFIRNFLLNNQLVGVYDVNPGYFFDNLTNSLKKIIHWFIPYSNILFRNQVVQIGIGFIIGAFLLWAALANGREGWYSYSRRISQPFPIACILFSGIYLIFMSIAANPNDTSYPEFDRYQLVILPCVLMLLFNILEVSGEMIARYIRLTASLNIAALDIKITGLVFLVFGASILTWFTYPVSNIFDYVQVTRQMGETRYNLYNTSALRHSEMIRIAREISRQSNLAFYSNYPAAAWFYLHRDIYPSPRDQSFQDGDTWRAIEKFQGWPGDKPGYLLWFLPNTYQHVLKVKTLAEFSDLAPVYRGHDGEIYQVKPLAP